MITQPTTLTAAIVAMMIATWDSGFCFFTSFAQPAQELV